MACTDQVPYSIGLANPKYLLFWYRFYRLIPSIQSESPIELRLHLDWYPTNQDGSWIDHATLWVDQVNRSTGQANRKHLLFWYQSYRLIPIELNLASVQLVSNWHPIDSTTSWIDQVHESIGLANPKFNWNPQLNTCQYSIRTRQCVQLNT